MDYAIIIYIFLGVLPSLVWLFYYLKKDLHPEPKKMIIRIFLWGAFITLPVFFVQVGLTSLIGLVKIDTLAKNLIYWFIIISFSEEFFKYLVVRIKVFNSPNLDEPLDIMLYMVISALGFAAIENVLYLVPTIGQISFEKALVIDLIRSIGAVFLHTLCSAVIGYSLAISFCEVKWKRTIALTGIVLATALHGLYDFSIMTLEGNIRFIIPAIVVLTLAFIVFVGFEKLKKMKGICKINKN